MRPRPSPGVTSPHSAYGRPSMAAAVARSPARKALRMAAGNRGCRWICDNVPGGGMRARSLRAPGEFVLRLLPARHDRHFIPVFDPGEELGEVLVHSHLDFVIGARLGRRAGAAAALAEELLGFVYRDRHEPGAQPLGFLQRAQLAPGDRPGRLRLRLQRPFGRVRGFGSRGRHRSHEGRASSAAERRVDCRSRDRHRGNGDEGPKCRRICWQS